jgi:SAM-dependent methyltransferase
MFEGLGQKLRAYAEKDGRGYPDWAMRYCPIVRGLKHRNLDRDRLLEIGANENGFARFAKVRTIVVDRALEHLRAARNTQPVLPLVADIQNLPFPDGAVDVCLCVDTFEHLPECVRGLAAKEILRVLKPSGEAVVAFPSGAAAAEAETRIRNAYAAQTGNTLRWFEEHIERGLPDAEGLATLFEQGARGAGGERTVIRKKNTSLFVWRMMWRILLCGWPGRGNALFQALLRLFTPLLTRIHVGTCYRAVLWIEPK